MPRQSYRIPLVTAALIFAAMLAQHVLSAIFSFGYTLAAVAQGVPGIQLLTVALDLVFAVGVFFSLWLIAPIAAGLRLSRVLLNAFIASAVGSALAAILAFIVAFFASARGTALMAPFNFGALASTVATVVGTLGNYLIFTTPLVLLAGVLLWLWLKARSV